MATEPERPIERLLRAWAKKRREAAGASSELHPATGRMLQGEVARRFARREARPASFFQRLGLPRIGFAEALMVLALAAVVVSLCLPPMGKSKNEVLLAMSEKKAPVELSGGAVRETARAPVASPATSAKETSQSLFASDESSLSKANGTAGQFQVAKQKAAMDRERLADTAKVSQTAPVIADASVAQPAAGPAARPASSSGPPVAASAPAESPAATWNYNHLARQPGVGDVPSAPPPEVQPSASSPTVATVENKRVEAALQPPGGSSPQLAFGSIAQEKDDLQAGAKLGLADARQAGEPVFADKIGVSNSGATSTISGLDGGFAVVTKQGLENNFAQRFSQVGPALAKVKAALNAPVSPVLVSFQVEQAGRDLRIVDSDGSVYTGPLEVAGAPARRRAQRSDSTAPITAPPAKSRMVGASAPAEAAPPAAQNYFFRVTGTNRSLQQNVVFTGNLITVTNAIALGQMNNASGGISGGRQTTLNYQQAAPVLNSQISGKLVIGNAKPTVINAISAPPSPPVQ